MSFLNAVLAAPSMWINERAAMQRMKSPVEMSFRLQFGVASMRV